MVWIVEDGSQVTNANTYLASADISAYALARGTTLAVGTLDVNIQKAMDYLQTLVYQGYKININQALLWPRNSVWIDEFAFPADAIPTQLKNAQCELTMAFDAGYDPLAVVTKADGAITKTMSPFSITYANNAVIIPIIQRVNIWLAQLTVSAGGNHFTIERTYG